MELVCLCFVLVVVQCKWLLFKISQSSLLVFNFNLFVGTRDIHWLFSGRLLAYPCVRP